MSHLSSNIKSIYLKADLHGARLEPRIDLSNPKQREAFRNLLTIMAEENHWAVQLLEAFESEYKPADRSHS
jgi:hypothetical protein